MTAAPLIAVLTAAVFMLGIEVADGNLITRGDFEAFSAGDTAGGFFGTDYRPNCIGIEHQCYSIVENPFGTAPRQHPIAASYGDHTTGAGLMLAVNGATDPGLAVWSQTVNVTPNTNYEFSLWVSSWLAVAPAQLIFDITIGSANLGSVDAPAAVAVWNRYTVSFNSGAASGAQTIRIRDLRAVESGNDFAIDDISLVAKVPEPTTLALLLVALSGLGFVRRRLP